jgi:hypothetical protein
MILKNWPFNASMEFDKKKGSFNDFLNEEATLIENNVVKLTSSRCLMMKNKIDVVLLKFQ